MTNNRLNATMSERFVVVPEKSDYQIVSAVDKDEEGQEEPTYPEDGGMISTKRGIFNQIISTCAILLLSAGCGMPIGYSAVLLPQLMTTTTTTMNATTSETELTIDIEMGSWIASVHSLATPFGSLLSGPLADHIGRRSALLISVIPVFIGWLTLALSSTVPMLIFGRFCCGFATGVLAGPAQVYIAETTEPKLRSLLIGAPYLSYSCGIMLVYVLGASMHWRAVAWSANLLPALAAIAIYCIPETPAWLLRRRRNEAALRALSFLRGNEICAEKELNSMKRRLACERTANPSAAAENIFQLCCQRAALKPLVIVIVFSLLQMFSGTYVVIFYAIDIIAEFGGDFDAKRIAIWTAGMRVACAISFCVILLYVRRRRIMLVASLGSGICCLALSALMMYTHVNTPNRLLIAGACLLGYIVFNTTLMVMPGIMIGELFPARIRGRTAGGVFAAMNVSLFIFAKAFPFLQAALKLSGVFLVFGVSSLLVAVFMALYQPETRGRTLDNIEDYFNGDNWLWMKRDMRYKLDQQSKAGAASQA